MKYLFWKDKKKRILFNAYENRIIFLKSIITNLSLLRTIRARATKQLISLPRDASITRIRNRCTFTNRPRAVLRKFGISRLMFRKYVWKGKLIGVRNSSW